MSTPTSPSSSPQASWIPLYPNLPHNSINGGNDGAVVATYQAPYQVPVPAPAPSPIIVIQQPVQNENVGLLAKQPKPNSKGYVPIADEEGGSPKKQKKSCCRRCFCCTCKCLLFSSMCCCILLLLAGVAALLVWMQVQRCMDPSHSDKKSFSFPVIKMVNGSYPSLSFDAGTGDINFHFSNSSTNYTAEIQLYGDTSKSLKAINVGFTQDGNNYKILAETARPSWWYGGSCQRVVIDFYFPWSDSVAMADYSFLDLSVKLDIGEVSLADVDHTLFVHTADFSLNVGQMTLQNFQSSNVSSASVKDGELDLEQFFAENITAYVKNGEMSLKSVTARYINASVHNGALTVSTGTLLQDTKTGAYGTIEGHVHNGNLNINNVNTGNIKTQVSHGNTDITVSSSTFNGMFTVNSSNNSITLKGDGKYSVTNKESGSVSGTIGNTVAGSQTISSASTSVTLTVNP